MSAPVGFVCFLPRHRPTSGHDVAATRAALVRFLPSQHVDAPKSRNLRQTRMKGLHWAAEPRSMTAMTLFRCVADQPEVLADS
jgi:hypothetical protein